jgi:putative acetyltransferase
VTPAIRDAGPDDVAAIASMVLASYRSAFLAIIGEAGLRERNAAYFAARLTRELAHVRIAVDAADRIVGMAEVRQGVLDMLFVDPASTGRGCGASLLRDAEARGARRLECFEANAAALRFYAREGWRETARIERPFAGASHRFVLLAKP